MQVRLQNYSDYLGRSGVKNPTWFCMAADFLVCTKHFEKLTQEAVVVFVYLVGECIRAKTSDLDISLRHASLYCMMSEEKIVQAIEVLEHVHLVIKTRARPDKNLSTEEERRGEKGRGVHAPEGDAVASDPELPLGPQGTNYDYDHPSVNTTPKATELPTLARLWNQHAHESLPRVKLCSAARRRHATNRWKENPSEEFWSDVIWRINASDFCLGKSKGDRGWRADFDWLCRPDTAARVLEGKYDNRGPGGNASTPPQLSYWARKQQQEGGADDSK